MEMKQRVVYYARTNRDEQNINEQIESVKKFIETKDNWKLVGGYSDENKSGANMANRLGLLQMLEDMTAHKFDIIIVKDTSRLSRNIQDSYKICNELSNYGIRVISLEEITMFRGQADRNYIKCMI